MAFATHDVLTDMRRAGNVPIDVLRVDGGATNNDWLMQFQADVLGVPVERPDVVETTALGAAGIAGVTVRHVARRQRLSRIATLHALHTRPRSRCGRRCPSRVASRGSRRTFVGTR